MIINKNKLLELAPIKDMETTKIKQHGVSYGLSEAGYDIRIKQDIRFAAFGNGINHCIGDSTYGVWKLGAFCLASAIEEFHVPTNLVGIVHDKSTWARKGISVFNTVIEPGFCGGLTLELVYHGRDDLHIPAGAGIAQVIFHQTIKPAQYDGKYQGQSTDPVESIFS